MPVGNKDDYRPIPFYFLTTTEDTALSREAIREAVGKLEAAGYGGCVVFNKPPTGFTPEEYLGEKWFRTTRYFIEEALKKHLAIWVNDDFTPPPGEAGGRIEKIAPHLKPQRLALEDDGSIAVKDVAWGFPAFEEPESSKLFIELIYEEYKKHLGEFFGRGIVGFFSDADNRRMPHAMLAENYFPWSGNFSSAFEKAYGYRVEPHLREILEWKGSQAAVDYWRLTGRLYQQWFANNHEWCRRNNLKYTFHTSDTGPRSLDETLRSSIFTEGDAFELHAHADLPGTDHELRGLNSGTSVFPDTLWILEHACWGQVNEKCRAWTFSNPAGDVRAKLASSATFLNSCERTMCEAFAATNWGCETDDLRRILVWQVMQGINFFVPHAVHHRVFGSTKYFAPPELMRYGVLAKSVKPFNDHLTDLCAIASRGQRIAPVALLDPTEEVWRTGRAIPRYFELCVELNRHPCGYVVAPLRAVIQNDKHFRVAINPGIPLSDEVRKQIAAAGVVLLESNETDRLGSLVPLELSFQGNGRPHFMRRRVEGGEMFLIANIEDEQEIIETVNYAGKEYTMALVQGEVAVFAPDGCTYRRPMSIRAKLPLCEMARVTWDSPNLITLFRWEDAAGVAKSTTESKGGELFFRWRNSEEVLSLQLLIPANAAATFAFDGVTLTDGKKRMVFDEAYLAYDFPASGASGEHVIAMKSDGIPWESPCYLEGDFDCQIEASGEMVPCFGYYNFKLDMPKFAKVTLGKRRATLRTNRSWARQGQMFYSGSAVYHFELTIPSDFKHPVLRLSRVHCRAELTVNGKDLGCRIFPPYDFDLQGFSGQCVAELRVQNTLGNQLDGYGAPSGLAAVPELIDIE
jgi:hypothetical protein